MTDDPIELLYYADRALWEAVLIGKPPPATAQMLRRMRNPRPGDLVIEISGFGRTFDPDNVGRLVRVEHPDDADLTRHVIVPLSRIGEEQGWQNAEFVAIPDQRSSFQWAEPKEEEQQ